MMPPTLPASAADRLALQVQIEELQAELSGILCPAERRQIARELSSAKAAIDGLREDG
ncbi:MAG: hypothetical protein WAP03_29955 [Methylorubrum rhodinum]|uniref:hypothetical protein n=1 Tax=Methylorubrum rhodinum TaxID=29428 RepID=UPI003BB0C876